jgi:hypothetical protein
MPRFTTLALVLLAVPASALSAQQRPPDRFPAHKLGAPDLGLVTAPTHVVTPVQAAAKEPARPFLAAVTRSVGAALVGGWLGFVSAQVVRSDWDKSSNTEFNDQRGTWAAAGAVLGLVTIRVVPRLGSHGDRGPGSMPATGRAVIAAADIRSSTARNALELIQSLRPEWLVVRGTQTWRETASGQGEGRSLTYTPGQPAIIAYMDGLRLGGVETLAAVPVHGLTSVEFLDAHHAVVRFGAGNTHGAIVLSSGVSAP